MHSRSTDRSKHDAAAVHTERASDNAATRAPETGESGGPKGPEPTRYGDWEKNGRCIDF